MKPSRPDGRPVSLRSLDLNLLTVFEALYAERNVTRAAARINLSQPAVSNALARLRRAFGDELFIRTPNGVEPTERATAIAAEVHQGLRHIDRALHPVADFDPARARRAFTLVATDYADIVLLPTLIRRLADDAPGVDLHVLSLGRQASLEKLDRGEIDFGFYVVSEAPKRITVEPLLQERFVCVARRGHPALRDGLDLAAYARLPHVLFSLAGDSRGIMDAVLESHGHRRRIALTVSHFLSIAQVVAQTGYIATVASRIAQQFAAVAPIEIHELPFEFPAWTIHLFWSRRNRSDPASQWFRDLLKSLCATL